MSAERRHAARLTPALRALAGAALLGAVLGATAQEAAADAPRYGLFYPSDDPLRVMPPARVRGLSLPAEPGLQSLPDCEALTWAHSPDADAAPPELALPQAISLALCQQPELRAGQASVGNAAAALGQARAAWWPSLSAGFSRTHQVQSAAGLSSAADHLDAIGRTIGLSWRLFDFGQRDSRERSQQQLLRAASLSLDAAARKLMLDVAQQYFAAQNAAALAGARELHVRLSEQMWRSAMKRAEQGLIDQGEALQARSTLARAQYELSVARGEADKARALLAQTVGFDGPVRFRLPVADASALIEEPAPESAPPALGPWLAVLRQQHPTVAAARAQLDSARANVEAVQREGLPSLELGWNLYDNGRPNQSLSARSTSERTVALTLRVPLFDGFLQTYKVMSARQQLAQREADLATAQAQVQKDALLVHADAVAAADNLAWARELAVSAREATASVQRRYERGAADLTQLNQSLASLNQARSELVRSWTEWQAARLRLAIQSALSEEGPLAPAPLPEPIDPPDPRLQVGSDVAAAPAASTVLALRLSTETDAPLPAPAHVARQRLPLPNAPDVRPGEGRRLTGWGQPGDSDGRRRAEVLP